MTTPTCACGRPLDDKTTGRLWGLYWSLWFAPRDLWTHLPKSVAKAYADVQESLR